MSKEAVTTKSVMSAQEKTDHKAVQSEYKGQSQFDRVKVTPDKDGGFVKAGKEYNVHPTTAMLWENKGLLSKGWEKKAKEYKASENGSSLQAKDVVKPE